MIKKIYLVFLLIVIVFILSGCTNIFKANKPELDEKVNEEIKYIDSEIIAILNSLNGIIYTNYKVMPKEVKQSNLVSNPDTQMNGTGNQKGSDQKESLESSGEKGNSSQESSENSSQGQSGNTSQDSKSNSEPKSNMSDKEDVKTLKMEPNTLLSTNNLEIDWDKLKSDIEILNASWITVKMDLKEIGVSENLLNNFSNELNNVIISIKNEDKSNTFNNLVNVYSLLYEFLNSYSDDKFKICVAETKKYTILVYQAIENDDFEKAKKEIEKTKQVFSNIWNYRNSSDCKTAEFEKTNVLIIELENSINLKDKELSFLKYKVLIQELSII